MANFEFYSYIFRRFLIGLQPLIFVAFTPTGGIDSSLTNSVEMLQANNIAINTTTDESCDFLRQSVEDWISAVGFTHNYREVSLHLLQFTMEPVRCDSLDSEEICLKLCEPHKDIINCEAACGSLSGKERESNNVGIHWYTQNFNIRPNDIFKVETTHKTMNYSLPNGTVVEADFFVTAEFNETQSVKRT